MQLLESTYNYTNSEIEYIRRVSMYLGYDLFLFFDDKASFEIVPQRNNTNPK